MGVAPYPLTHYIPYLTHIRPDGLQLSICDIYVERREFSTEPTCHACAAYLAKEADWIEDLRRMP